MMDITDRMQSYRECVRHIWNTHFRAEAEQSQDWDLRDDFCDAALMLFRALVLRGLDVGEVELLPDYRAEQQPLSFVQLTILTGIDQSDGRQPLLGRPHYPAREGRLRIAVHSILRLGEP